MKKYLLYAAAAIIGVAAIASSVVDSGKRNNIAAPTVSASASASQIEEPNQKLVPSPDASEDTLLPAPELEIDDLGEDTCKEFEVCTFVDIVANETCTNAEVVVDLFDEYDEDFDSESVMIGTIKKGAHLRNVEVGTDDTDAEYVEQSDFICG